jgi:hypothetical protein
VTLKKRLGIFRKRNNVKKCVCTSLQLKTSNCHRSCCRKWLLETTMSISIACKTDWFSRQRSTKRDDRKSQMMSRRAKFIVRSVVVLPLCSTASQSLSVDVVSRVSKPDSNLVHYCLQKKRITFAYLNMHTLIAFFNPRLSNEYQSKILGQKERNKLLTV